MLVKVVADATPAAFVELAAADGFRVTVSVSLHGIVVKPLDAGKAASVLEDGELRAVVSVMSVVSAPPVTVTETVCVMVMVGAGAEVHSSGTDPVDEAAAGGDD